MWSLWPSELEKKQQIFLISWIRKFYRDFQNMRFVKNHQWFWKLVFSSFFYEIMRFLWPANASLYNVDSLNAIP